MKIIKKCVAIILTIMLVSPINLTVYANDDGNSKQRVATQNILIETGEAVTVKVPYYEDSYTITNGVEPVLYTSSNSDVATAYKTGISMSSSGSTISVEILGKTAGNADITISMRETGEVLAEYSVTVTKSATSTLRLCQDEHTTISFKYTTKNYKYKLSNSSANMNIHKQSTSQSSINGNYQSSTSLEISFDMVGEYTLTIYDDNNSIITEYDVIISEHSFDDGVIIKEPTCTDEGTKQYTCQKCGATLENSDGAEALGHNYSEEWSIDKESTCTEEGSKSKHCLRCGAKSEITTIEKTDHTWNAQYTVDKEATCKEEGIQSIHCSVCNSIKEGSEKSIPLIEHTWDEGTLTTDVTCTENGEKTYTCTVCGETKKEQVETTGHIWNEDYTVDKEPTCTEDGEKSIHCSKCGAIKEGSIEKIEVIEHTYSDWTIVNSPTYAKKGLKKKTCSLCGGTIEEEIPILEAESVTFNKSKLTLEIGKESVLTVIADPAMVDGDEVAIKWESEDEKIATVDADGKVIANNVGTTIINATVGGKTANCEVTVVKTNIRYKTHVQSYGWQEWVTNGETSGTEGQAKRLEGIKIEIEGDNGSLQYRTHIQSIGWQDWVKNGEMSGTEGQALRLEAIQIKLTGEMAEQYDIYYCVHSQTYGWLNWAKNGEIAGTAGQSKRLEAIKIILVAKGGDAPDKIGTDGRSYVQYYVGYRTHVQTYGWQPYVYDGTMSGTTGESKRLEAINIKLMNQEYDGDIEYQTHVQTYGWERVWKKDGDTSGTSGEAKRLEAIRIRLTDEMAEKYDVYYRVHAQTFGWLGWAKNGKEAGTAGYGKRLEGIQIMLVKKGEAAPGSTDNAFVEK